MSEEFEMNPDKFFMVLDWLPYETGVVLQANDMVKAGDGSVYVVSESNEGLSEVLNITHYIRGGKNEKTV